MYYLLFVLVSIVQVKSVLICSAGFYLAHTTDTSCTVCPANFFSGSPGSTACTACGTQQYAAPGSSACTSCNYNFDCVSGPYMVACTVCPANEFRTLYPPDYCASTTTDPTVVRSYCSPCKIPSECAVNTYLNFVCDGTTMVKNACLACDTGACPNFLTYRRACTSTQNSDCSLTYPTCAAGYYLNGAGVFTSGTCTPCSTCTAPSTVMASCSVFTNTACTQTCSYESDCTSGVCVYYTSPASCVNCPMGYTRSPNKKICIPCPRGGICDQYTGVLMCMSTCPINTMPTCTTCTPCNLPTVNTDPNAIALRSHVFGTCAAYTQCKVGYYKNFLQSQCVACPGAYSGSTYYITRGLVDNDETSCLKETRGPWAGNSAGYWGLTNVICPPFTTSPQNHALSSTDCKPCPEINIEFNIIYTNRYVCEWYCAPGFHAWGSRCINDDELPLCSSEEPGMVYDDPQCSFRPIPWQAPGYEYSTWYIFTTEILFPIDKIVSYNPFTWTAQLVTMQVNPKSSYFASDRNFLQSSFVINQIISLNTYQTVGTVCSAAYNSSNTIFFTYCNVSMVFYIDKDKKPQRLIGSETMGYKEGMKNDALFENELYVAVSQRPETGIDVIIVLDTYNCMLREILIGPDGAGDFRTKSFLLYGSVANGQPLCDKLTFPRYLWPLMDITLPIWAFLHNGNTICQVHTLTKKVACTTIIWTDIYPIRSIRASNDGLYLIVITDYSKTFYSNSGGICADDYTSYKGSACSLYYPWNNGAFGTGYYLNDGVPVLCSAATCGWGYSPQPCTRTGPSVCTPCNIISQYPFYYLSQGSCDFSYNSTCPQNMYTDTTPRKTCIQCPKLMYTKYDFNTLGYSSCLCPFPLQKVGTDCILTGNQSLYPLFLRNVCVYNELYDIQQKKCQSCVDTPCYLPKIGQYPVACFTQPLNCTIPANAYAISVGLPNSPSSCLWKCLPGYTIQLSSCIPCANTLPGPQYYYYDDTCTYAAFV